MKTPLFFLAVPGLDKRHGMEHYEKVPFPHAFRAMQKISQGYAMARHIYSGFETLPRGIASDSVTPGCLVLEGGALRGTYSVGVMDALMQNDINFSCTIGVSAGALNGISYVSGQIGRSARSPLRYRHDPRYFGLGAYLRNGTPFGFDFMFGELTHRLDPLDLARFFRPERRFTLI